MPTEQTELREKVAEIVDYVAEIYCILGENPKMSSRRTRPMKAGAAYADEIMQLFQTEKDRIRAEVLDEVEASVDNLYKYSIVNLELKERNDDEPVEAILPSEVKSILASLRGEGKV